MDAHPFGAQSGAGVDVGVRVPVLVGVLVTVGVFEGVGVAVGAGPYANVMYPCPLIGDTVRKSTSDEPGLIAAYRIF
jgi:hypothetical protein